MRRDCEGPSDAIGLWQHVEAGLQEQAEHLRNDLAVSRQESRELQERLMVSEATVHALNDQLKDYRELLSENTIHKHRRTVHTRTRTL